MICSHAQKVRSFYAVKDVKNTLKAYQSLQVHNTIARSADITAS
ncbi:hypothetical protein SAMN06265374_1711 [Roseibium denhamense]|uniref:Uncharacterized protein n=1 Tax=Roseibium denhamense TaxID=76305 RepID=A0ABY1NS29_9HYPH|nr:hypothetical protein SAMN06265374_1711 [Roseibium denhamense]